jgi:hypothetical protein
MSRSEGDSGIQTKAAQKGVMYESSFQDKELVRFSKLLRGQRYDARPLKSLGPEQSSDMIHIAVV